jgi:hypothetical protein
MRKGLPFCSNCGEELLSGVKFCPNCGAPQAAGVGSPRVRGSSLTSVMKRPAYASILTVSHVALGLLFAFLGTLIFALGLSAFNIIFGALLLAVGIASVWTGYGFLRLRSWLTGLGVFTSIGYLVGGVLMILSSGVLIAVGAMALIQATGTLICLRMTGFSALLRS